MAQQVTPPQQPPLQQFEALVNPPYEAYAILRDEVTNLQGLLAVLQPLRLAEQFWRQMWIQNAGAPPTVSDTDLFTTYALQRPPQHIAAADNLFRAAFDVGYVAKRLIDQLQTPSLVSLGLGTVFGPSIVPIVSAFDGMVTAAQGIPLETIPNYTAFPATQLAAARALAPRAQAFAQAFVANATNAANAVRSFIIPVLSTYIVWVQLQQLIEWNAERYDLLAPRRPARKVVKRVKRLIEENQNWDPFDPGTEPWNDVPRQADDWDVPDEEAYEIPEGIGPDPYVPSPDPEPPAPSENDPRTQHQESIDVLVESLATIRSQLSGVGASTFDAYSQSMDEAISTGRFSAGALGESLKGSSKQVLSAVGRQATVKGAFEIAEAAKAFANEDGDGGGKHLASAGQYFAVATLAGAGAGAIGATQGAKSKKRGEAPRRGDNPGEIRSGRGVVQRITVIGNPSTDDVAAIKAMLSH